MDHLDLNIKDEIRKRIRLAVAAYAYEVLHTPVMSDAEFDALALEINLSVDTGRPDLDKWWRDNFDSDTGIWIYRHPEIARIAEIAETLTKEL